jgi:syntaxin 16
MKQLREMQQRHLTRPSFSDDGGDEQEAKLEQTTSDVTGMLAHCHRLIGTVEHADNCHRAQQLLQQNVTASLLVALQTLTIEFRTQQNRYLQSIETRAGNVDHYFADTSDWKEQTTSAELFATAPEQGLSMVQMQQLMENADVVREREREIISVGRSILELNTLFKGILY